MPKDELIAALEKADGPDRELDALIWLLVNYPDWRKHKDWRKTNGWAEESRPSSMVSYYTADGLGGSGSANHYTASIDAALTLVPEGWSWSVDHLLGQKPGAVLNNKPFSKTAIATEGATPALAICIAALRATERGEAGR